MTIAGLVERWRGSERLQDRTAAAGTFAAGAVFNLVGLTGIWGAPRFDGPGWAHTVLLAAGCLAMLGKRRHPMRALGAGAVVAAADLAVGGSIAMVLVVFDLIFSVGVFATARARHAVTTVVFVLIGTASVVGGLAAGEFRIAVFIALQLTTLLFVPLWWAANIRQQRRLGQLAAERTAREAVVAERAAMARDLHDVIAAHLSTTAIHSGAALAAPPDTERDRAALRAVRTSSLAALEDMRSMIMLLRADAAPAADPALPGGLDRLPELVDAATADGLRVEVHTRDVPELPVLVGQATYRIVREALTNARKHAPASHVRLDVKEAGATVSVTVTNTLTRAGGLGHQALSAGTGLTSMRERAALLGGELTAGREGDRWRVHATLPLHPEELS
ncbi:sensor histidine kinase [Paractinoplanes rishiriensis]|uniref:histidine kinase n=1 Tax=Paractinoplanes rishiriensis TaxID=1050105 RepID=A0A919MPL6_9ACTN|nr:histidine kinase [Actinoplanes rishiriensis]GIE95211.1 two-component sensor histidine kinase [Actinoplanes rishiriensis]